ncbi:MAG: hypothetical protein H8D33_03930 [Cryomorphaceae bacterium]|nr:hypothetical protein [Cryomorphaceae bacterium]
MKRIFTTIILSITLLSAEAQIEKLAGPRVGVTMITPGSLASIIRGDVPFFSDEIREEWTGSTGEYGAAISQYGWQWESRFSDAGNITGIVEWIALVGGMEKGMFLPSVSSMVGLRTVKGIEFAVGPNLSLGGIAMVFGAGYNFKFGKLNVPVNIAYVPSMNKTYNHDSEYEWVEYEYDDGDDQPSTGGGYEIETSKKYSVTHPTGARISVMVGFNLSK